jgi:hypothetical protein
MRFAVVRRQQRLCFRAVAHGLDQASDHAAIYADIKQDEFTTFADDWPT